MADVASDWQQLHNRYYRKKEVYADAWPDLDLSRQILVGAPHAGAVAVLRNTNKVVAMTGKEGELRRGVQIYSLSGGLVASLPEPAGKVVRAGWTSSERLVLVQDDGLVLIYSVSGELESTVALSKEAGVGIAVDAVVYGDGVVVLASRPKIFLVALTGLGTENPDVRLKKFADPELTEAPLSWTIIEPQFTASHQIEVLLATQGGNVIVVDQEKRADQHLAVSPIVRMSVSPTGKILACFNANGNLWVVSSDFAKNLSEFPTKSKAAPQQLVWCGTDAVVLYWDKHVLLVGPYNEFLSYNYDMPITLLAELDGVRIISSVRSEMLQRVPQVVEDTFKIPSTAPPAMLVYALEHFDKKDPKADELIRSISKDLAVAVSACIEAAGHEYAVATQRLLLRAASFGKCFLDGYNPAPYVDMCRTLRVLNAVRDSKVGVPLTMSEFRALGIEGLVGRLMARRKHQLALRICEFLHIKTDRVLVHWACERVKSGGEDAEAVQAEIVRKLGNVAGVSFAEIASTAYRAGRHELATRLLDHEPRAADQVPLLLSMKEEERALNKAVDAGDPDLVYLVVLHLRRHRPGDFISMVRSRPVALALLVAYAKQQEPGQLRDLYEQMGLATEVASLLVHEAYRQDDVETRARCLQAALNAYKNAASASKDGSSALLSAQLTEDEVKLLLLQRDLEASTRGQSYVGQSLYNTLFAVLTSGDAARATKIKDSFKVPDKRFAWIKLKALASTRRWDELDRFSKEKKLPVGMEAFAQACLAEGNQAEATKYAVRIVDPKPRAEFLVRLGAWREATEAAKEARDIQLLVMIANKTPSRDLQGQIEQIINQLRR